jgi:hypothetical protein
MAIRKHLLVAYTSLFNGGVHMLSDRIGDQLSSGGDCEINIQVLLQGYCVGYFPDLMVTHLIPESRLTVVYLAKLNYASTRSWVELLRKYRICPWPAISKWTLPIRKLKAWIYYQPWLGPEQKVRWSGICGLLDGSAT